MTLKNDSPQKKQNSLWPDIDSLESARETANQGFWAAILVAVFTTIMVLVTSQTGSMDNLPPMNAWSFIDVGIYVAIALGIRKMSRIAAVCGLLLYSIDRIYLWSQTGANGSVVLSIFFMLAFIHGVRGTFAYHRLRRQSLQESASDFEIEDTMPG